MRFRVCRCAVLPRMLVEAPPDAHTLDAILEKSTSRFSIRLASPQFTHSIRLRNGKSGKLRLRTAPFLRRTIMGNCSSRLRYAIGDRNCISKKIWYHQENPLHVENHPAGRLCFFCLFARCLRTQEPSVKTPGSDRATLIRADPEEGGIGGSVMGGCASLRWLHKLDASTLTH